MKKVLQVPAHLYIGGVEKVARDIGMYADTSKYDFDYIVFDEEIGIYEEELKHKNYRVFHLQEPSSGYVSFFKSIYKIMSETDYDIIHVHTMFNIGWFMLFAAIKRIPIRVAHAHSALDTGGGFVKRSYEKAMRFLINVLSTDYVACGEKAGIRLYGKHKYDKKGNLILNGIDVYHFKYNNLNRQQIRQSLGWEDKYIIGHVGHLLDVKNQQFLIGLMPDLLEINPDVRLVLLGDGPDKDMLIEKIKDLNLEAYVQMTGNVTNVNEYLSAMDVFAFPSLYEGMPLSLVEVQANGLPCVISTGVPHDVYITDLIQPVSLEDRKGWIDAICQKERHYPEQYADDLYNAGFDTVTAMRKIYSIYEGKI